MIRAAGYLRVSSAQQRDRVTIESQRRDVPAYIAAMGWAFAGLYEDDGHTAKAGHLDARDGFARLRAAIIPERIDVVVVVAIDRLTRSEDPVERAQVVAALAPAQLAIVGAGIQDVRTFAGDAYVTLQALFAAEENRRRRARVIAGHVTAIGHRPGAGRPARGALPRVTGTVPAGIPARLAAVLDAGESTSQLVGSAVVAEVERREKER